MVNAIAVYSGGVVTGGKDGFVKLWTRDLGPLSDFDVRGCKPCLYPRIRSVDVSPDEKRLLVGSQAGEIFEMSIIDGKSCHAKGPLVQSHFKGNVMGLACHPAEPFFATVGDDATLRLWSLDDMAVRQAKELDSASRAVAFSPDGLLIAVGLGKGGAKATRDGAYLIFQAGDLSIMHEGRDSQEWVRDLSFSPDGRKLACACQDNKIFIYDTTDGFARSAVISAHQAPVTAMDWSSDSLYLMSMDEAKVLLFADAGSGVQIPVAATLKDAKWATQTGWLNWASQGMHPNKESGEALVATDRQHNGKLVCAADNYGRIKLYNYPTYEHGHGFSLYRGHVGSVGSVRWVAGDNHLVSVGRSDRCVFQWRVLPDGVLQEGDPAGDSGDDSEVDRDCGRGNAQGMERYAEGVAEAALQQEKSGGGDKKKAKASKGRGGSAVKPWLTSLVPPSKVNSALELSDAPPVSLALDFAHGTRCGDVRNAVRYNAFGDIVYPAAAMGVIYNAPSHSQQYHTGHRGDVVAMAMDTQGLIFATGDGSLGEVSEVMRDSLSFHNIFSSAL